MQASEFTFGVEFETTVPAGAVAVGSYTRGASVPGLPSGWVAKYDCSIRAGRGRRGAEFVSPVLRGADGLRQIIKVCEVLNGLGAKVNASCGLHVHVGWSRTNVKGLKCLIHEVANYEGAIYATTGTKKRERGTWCRSVRADFRALNYNGPMQGLGYAAGDRYHLCNVSNLMGCGHGHETVEFRAFSGTLNASKAIAYVRLCLAFAERAQKNQRLSKWEPKPTAAKSSHARKGAGLTQLTRLFYALGWIRGRISHVYGAVVDDGLPTMDESKRELRRLAKKYDQDDGTPARRSRRAS